MYIHLLRKRWENLNKELVGLGVGGSYFKVPFDHLDHCLKVESFNFCFSSLVYFGPTNYISLELYPFIQKQLRFKPKLFLSYLRRFFLYSTMMPKYIKFIGELEKNLYFVNDLLYNQFIILGGSG